MRIIASILVISGLCALSASILTHHEIAVAACAVALAVLWGAAIALRWTRAVHTACLVLTAVLCALSTFISVPLLTILLCLSATLHGWDLMLIDLQTAAHPRDMKFNLARKYSVRCLMLAGLGIAVTLGARAVHVRLSFFSAFAASCLCLILFSKIQHRARLMMSEGSPAKKERTAKPPA